jgi:hypothetical protein
MKLRTVLAVLGATSLLAVPGAFAAHGADGHTFAAGGATWTIPLPNAFGLEIGNVLAFAASTSADGALHGHFVYQQTADGATFRFTGRVTCFGIYDGYRAKIGGIVTSSNDPTLPVGTYGWFQVFDNGGTRPDQSSLMGFGDEAANEAFCASSRLPRFGPWDVTGRFIVGGA